MRAVDTNVLVYAFFADSPFHESARTTVAGLANGAAPWGIPWPCLHEFFAVVTNPRLFPGADLATRARAQVDAWLASPSLQLLGETSTHWRTLAGLLDAGRVVGPAVHDARIAAICLDHRVSELITQDRDFTRFPALQSRSVA